MCYDVPTTQVCRHQEKGTTRKSFFSTFTFKGVLLCESNAKCLWQKSIFTMFPPTTQVCVGTTKRDEFFFSWSLLLFRVCLGIEYVVPMTQRYIVKCHHVPTMQEDTRIKGQFFYFFLALYSCIFLYLRCRGRYKNKGPIFFWPFIPVSTCFGPLFLYLPVYFLFFLALYFNWLFIFVSSCTYDAGM